MVQSSIALSRRWLVARERHANNRCRTVPAFFFALMEPHERTTWESGESMKKKKNGEGAFLLPVLTRTDAVMYVEHTLIDRQGLRARTRGPWHWL